MNVGEFVSEHKVPLAIGAGGIVLFLVLRGRSGPQVAAQAPADGAPTPVVAPPAASQDMGVTGTQASAIQNQIAQQHANQEVAAGNLALLGAQQQLQYQGQANQISLAEQQHTADQLYYAQQQQGKLLHNEVRQTSGGGGFFQQLFGTIGQAAGAYRQYASLPGVPLPGGSAQSAPRTPSQPTPLLGGMYPTAGQIYGG